MGNEDMAACARSLVGVPFRPQGRDSATGLDCIGLVAAAAGIRPDRVPDDYRLRGDDHVRLHSGLAACGFRRLAQAYGEAGDVVVVRAGPQQLHLIVLTNEGFVQAHAGLRRVVETPGTAPGPSLSAWRHTR